MKTNSLILIFTFLSFLTYAQKEIHFFPANYAKDGKAGFIDSNGKVVIPYKFDEVFDFSEGLAVVKSGELYGYIDKSGKLVIPAKFVFAYPFSSGVAKVYYQDKTQYINKKGDIINVPSEAYEDYFDGVVKLKIGEKFGFADNRGKIIVPAEYIEAYDFRDGIGYAKLADTWYFFDKTGKLLFKTKNDPIGRYSEGLIQVKDDDKFGFMDKSGKMQIPVKFQFRNSTENLFSEGLAVFQEGPGFYDYKMGCIDKSGKVMIKPEFDLIYPFKNGCAVYGNGKDDAFKKGYIDKTGKIIVKARYEEAFDFSDGLAVAIRKLGDGKYQYEIINIKGEIIKTFEAYEGIREPTLFVQGLCKLHQTISASPDLKEENMRQWGAVKTIYVNMKGKIVWESEPWYSCFPSNAKVLMADFSEKPIDQIILGDEILSFNQETENFEKKSVTEIQVHSGSYHLIEILYSSNSELTASGNNEVSNPVKLLEVTENHPIMTIYGNIAASMIKAGDEIFVLNSLTKHIEIKKVEKIVKDYRSENKVYNLKLKGENYIVDGVVVMMK